jgi:hypothetical protein
MFALNVIVILFDVLNITQLSAEVGRISLDQFAAVLKSLVPAPPSHVLVAAIESTLYKHENEEISIKTKSILLII